MKPIHYIFKLNAYHKKETMCGRYSEKKDLKIVEDQLKLRLSEKAKNWKPSFNIAPSQLAPVVTSDDPDLIDVFHFGLVPHWAKDKKIGYKMINARSETLLEKPSYKPLLINNKRCLVLADSFFEWKKEGKKSSRSGFIFPKGISFSSPGYGRVGKILAGKRIIHSPSSLLHRIN